MQVNLVPVYHTGAHDFWPHQFVLEKWDEDTANPTNTTAATTNTTAATTNTTAATTNTNTTAATTIPNIGALNSHVASPLASNDDATATLQQGVPGAGERNAESASSSANGGDMGQYARLAHRCEICLCMYVYKHKCIYSCIHTHTYMHTYIHTYIQWGIRSCHT
jgi:hypothetical protein